jgi:5-formyltetrahydrofolate cyclo-ligase
MGSLPEKAALREQLLASRAAIPSPKRRLKSAKIFAKLFKTTAYRKARRVAFYHGTADEVRTRPFLEKIIKEKELYLPRVGRTRRLLSLCRIRDLKRDLRKGTYAIMEPRMHCAVLSASGMDLIVVPGVGFDRCGGRLGRGAGYYDRLLKKMPGVHKIGICYREQLVQNVPVAKHDIAMDQVITD